MVYHSQEPDWSFHANRYDILQSIGKKGFLLIGARSGGMHNGLDKAGTARDGHNPGAVNLAARRETNQDGSFNAWRVPTVRPDGTFIPVEELRASCDTLGNDPDKEINAYCIRGGLSTHARSVLAQALPFPHVRECDRSWAEWGNQEALRIEQ